MEQGQKLKLSGGSVSGLTSSTILYGLGGNVVDLDFNKIRYNKLYPVFPLILDNTIHRTTLEEGSNVLSIDLTEYYKKDEVNSNISVNKDIFYSPFRSNITTNEISIDSNAFGWFNSSNNILYNLQSNVGIGTTTPLSLLHLNTSLTSSLNCAIHLSVDNIIDENCNLKSNYFRIGFDENNINMLFGHNSNNNILIIDKTSSNDSLCITSHGVGIGTTTTKYNNVYYELNVNGTLNTTDDLFIKGINYSNIITSATRSYVETRIAESSTNQILSGNGSNITNVNYNTLSNLPSFKYSYPFLTSNDFNILDLSSIGGWNSNLNTIFNITNRIGIGTNNALELLHIGSTSDQTKQGAILISSRYSQSILSFKMGFNANNNFIIGGYDTNTLTWLNQFYINSNAPTNSLVVSNTGFIGIGKASPQYSLDVNGSINTNASLFANNINTNNLTTNNLTTNNLITTVDLNVSDLITGDSLFISNLATLNNLYTSNTINTCNLLVSNLNVSNSISTSNLISSNITVNSNIFASNLTLNNALNVRNSINVSNIITSNLIRTNALNVSNLITTSNLTASNLITGGSLNISNLITASNLNISNNLNSSNINVRFLTVNSNLTTSNLNISNLLTTSNINASNLNISNLITSSNINVLRNLTAISLNVSNLTSSNLINSLTIFNRNTLTSSNINASNLNISNSITANNLYANNIGIKTINPLADLQIGESNSNYSLIIAGSNNYFKFSYDDSNNFNFGNYDSNINDWTNQFYINSNASSNSLVINSNGCVGINTSITNYNLDVNGSINATSLYCNNIKILSSIDTSNLLNTSLTPYITSNTASNIFTTSNYVDYNISSNFIDNINNLFAFNSNILTFEYKLPSTTFTSCNIANTPIKYNDFGFNSYKYSILTINDPNPYTNGSYNIYVSSSNTSNPFNYGYSLIDNQINVISTVKKNFQWAANNYLSTNNSPCVYVGPPSYLNINDNYNGDFFVIKFPKNILMTKYRFYTQANNADNFPLNWRCYGSYDGINFYTINEASSTISFILTDYVYVVGDDVNNRRIYYYYEKILPATFTKTYNYIGFVFSRLYSTKVRSLILAAVEIYGKVSLNNLFISSNVLFNYTNQQFINNLTTISNIYTNEYIFPTTVYNSVTTNNTLSLNPPLPNFYCNCYSEELIVNNPNLNYGNGSYNIYSSSTGSYIPAASKNFSVNFTTALNSNFNNYLASDLIANFTSNYNSNIASNLSTTVSSNLASNASSNYASNITSNIASNLGNDIIISNKYLLFNYLSTYNTFWKGGQYTNGVANTSFCLNANDNYYGDFIVLQLPSYIIMSKYILYYTSEQSSKAPGDWICYGSSNGSNFFKISTVQKGTFTYNTDDSSNFYYQQNIPNLSNITYNYIGFVFNKLLYNNSSNTQLALSSIQIYGYQLLQPLYVNSNFVTNTLSTYIPYSNINNILSSCNFINSNQLSLKQDKINCISPLLLSDGSNISINLTGILAGTGNDSLSNLSNLLVDYINSSTKIWDYSPNSSTNIYYKNGSVGISTDKPNLNYSLDVYGNINASNINISNSIIASNFIGNGSKLSNINYQNIINSPNLSNLNNWIYNNGNVYTNSGYIGIGIAAGNYLDYMLTVRGSIFSSNIINCSVLQENGINISSKYLLQSSSSNIFLLLSGGTITRSLTVNSNIITSNLIAINFTENGIPLSQKYLTLNNANNIFQPLLNAFSNVIINSLTCDLIQVNNIITFSTVTSSNFVENGLALSSKYLNQANAAIIYQSNLIPTCNLTLNNLTTNNLTNLSNINSSNFIENGLALSSKYLSQTNASIIYQSNLISSCNLILNNLRTSNLTILSNLNVSNIIENGVAISSKYLTSNIANGIYQPILVSSCNLNLTNLTVNSNILVNNLNITSNTFSSNFIENGVSLSSKYLTLNNASNTYQPIIISSCNLNINNLNSSNLTVASNILTSNLRASNINALTFTENGNSLSNIYLTLNNASNIYQILLNSSCNLNLNNLSSCNFNTNNITTTNLTAYLNINANTFIENGSSLSSIYLTQLNASNIYQTLLISSCNLNLNNINTCNLFNSNNLITSNLLSSNLNTISLNTSSLLASNINTIDLNTSNLTTTNLNTNNLNTSNLNTCNLNTSNLNTNNLNTSNLISSIINTDILITSIIITSNINTSNLNTCNLNTSNLNTNNLNTINLNTSNLNTSSLNTSSLNTTNLNSSNINSSNLITSNIINSSLISSSNIIILNNANINNNITANGIINSLINLQENGINLSNKYLSIVNASNQFLLLSGGTITSNLIINSNVSIGLQINPLYQLNVNGSIFSSNNINAFSNLQENGINLNNKYLTIVNASNQFILGSGGIINSNLTINGNIGIGTNSTPLYKLIINGNLYSYSNISALYNLQEGGVNLINKYLTLNGGIINSNLTVAGSINSSNTINAISNLQEGGVNLINKYLTLNGGTITSNLTVVGSINSSNTINAISNLQEGGVNLINKYLTSVTASNYYLPLNGGTITSNLTVVGSIISSNNINAVSNLQEGGVNLINKYLTSVTASNYYLPLNGGTITSNLTVVGSINSSNNINAISNLQEGGVNLINKYLTSVTASNFYLPLNGGTITSNLTVVGSIISSNNINAVTNLQEGGVNLINKYLTINTASLTYVASNTMSNLLTNNANIQKKLGFLCQCTNPIILNGNTYYKHDINLSYYTNIKYDSVNSNPYRIFGVRCFETSTIFNTLNITKPPNVIQYDVYTSLLNSSNVNLCAIGFPINYYLNKITDGNIFLLQTTNFNYISLVSRTQNTNVICILTDFLF